MENTQPMWCKYRRSRQGLTTSPTLSTLDIFSLCDKFPVQIRMIFYSTA